MHFLIKSKYHYSLVSIWRNPYIQSVASGSVLCCYALMCKYFIKYAHMFLKHWKVTRCLEWTICLVPLIFNRQLLGRYGFDVSTILQFWNCFIHKINIACQNHSAKSYSWNSTASYPRLFMNKTETLPVIKILN